MLILNLCPGDASNPSNPTRKNDKIQISKTDENEIKFTTELPLCIIINNTIAVTAVMLYIPDSGEKIAL